MNIVTSNHCRMGRHPSSLRANKERGFVTTVILSIIAQGSSFTPLFSATHNGEKHG